MYFQTQLLVSWKCLFLVLHKLNDMIHELERNVKPSSKGESKPEEEQGGQDGQKETVCLLD